MYISTLAPPTGSGRKQSRAAARNPEPKRKPVAGFKIDLSPRKSFAVLHRPRSPLPIRAWYRPLRVHAPKDAEIYHHASMRSPIVDALPPCAWPERTGSRRGPCHAAVHYQALERGRQPIIKACGIATQLGDGVAITAKNRLALTLRSCRRRPSGGALPRFSRRPDPDAARRLEIVGGVKLQASRSGE
jgi:hypothetical protein